MKEQQTFTVNYAHQLTCSKCNHSLRLKNDREIKLFVCPKCFFIDGSKLSKDYAKIKVNDPSYLIKIDLGATGIYKKRSFQVIGVILKSESSHYNTTWWEYCLQYDDDGTIFFLSLWNGHYTFYEKIQGEVPVLNLDHLKVSIDYNNKSFEYFDTYGYKTRYALGAFPYDIVDVRKNKIYDYVNPPHLLSFEIDSTKETTCFLGTYVYPKQVAEIFNNPALKFSDRTSVAPAQPFYGGIDMRIFNRIALIFLGLFILANIFVFRPGPTRSLAYRTLNFEENAEKVEYVSESFNLPNTHAPYFLSFSGDASLDNSWVEMQFSLINEKTGKEEEIALGLEYYSGVDDGYSWSEGSQSSETYLSSVEAGKYHVKVTMLKPSTNLITEARFAVRTDSPVGWNFRTVIIPFGIIIILLNLLHRQFNRIKFGEIDTLFGN